MMKREDVLMEALPYIQQFHGKTIVIKLGGHAMVHPVVLKMPYAIRCSFITWEFAWFLSMAGDRRFQRR